MLILLTPAMMAGAFLMGKNNLDEGITLQEDYIEKIIANFSEQCVLYRKMEDLSARQLQILASKNGNDTNGLRGLLAERSRLLEGILQLTAVNKELQQQIKEALNVEEFSMSRLDGHVAEEDYKRMQELVNELGILLEKINNNDKRSQSIMKNSLISHDTVIRTKQVEKLYRKAMRDNSPEN